MRAASLLILWLAIAGAALTGPASADYRAGKDAYERGDYALALSAWRPLAEAGDANAQYNLGAMYSDGLGVPKNDAEAVRWYRMAAEQGHAEAQAALALKFYAGSGVPRDYAQAASWGRKAADQRHPGGYALLGLLHVFPGPGFPADDVKAFAYFTVARALGGSQGNDIMRDILSRAMTRDQIAEARRMASACAKKDYKGCVF